MRKIKTKQQQKDEAYTAYEELVVLAGEVYDEKIRKIAERDDIKIIDGKRYKLIKD